MLIRDRLATVEIDPVLAARHFMPRSTRDDAHIFRRSPRRKPGASQTTIDGLRPAIF